MALGFFKPVDLILEDSFGTWRLLCEIKYLEIIRYLDYIGVEMLTWKHITLIVQ